MPKFVKGQVANPKGRPKGSKHAISEDYLRAMSRDFEQHGAEVIERVRTKKPDVYLRLIAMLVPRDFRVQSEKTTYVIKATPELTVDQWRTLHQLGNAKEIKEIEHVQ